jgi:hypothetical protein
VCSAWQVWSLGAAAGKPIQKLETLIKLPDESGNLVFIFNHPLVDEFHICCVEIRRSRQYMVSGSSDREFSASRGLMN